MNMLDLGDVKLHYRVDGDPDGAPVVFVNSLRTDMRLWDDVLPRLPKGLKFIRFDKRGHGLSSLPPAPYTMGALVHDTERLLDHLKVRDSLLVGLSIGGMIAQGLAVKRTDLIRAMVLSNTGAKIGTKDIWKDRIEQVNSAGVKSLADAVMIRWFSEKFRAKPELELWYNMLVRTPDAGYAGCSAAIAGSDFYASTAKLRLPTLGIAGSEDGSTPPDLVRETVDLIPGSQFHLIRGVGHIPCVEQAEEYAKVLTKFINDTGHI
jgi:3-oxoadipate enol-lactonase